MRSKEEEKLELVFTRFKKALANEDLLEDYIQDVFKCGDLREFCVHIIKGLKKSRLLSDIEIFKIVKPYVAFFEDWDE